MARLNDIRWLDVSEILHINNKGWKCFIEMSTVKSAAKPTLKCFSKLLVNFTLISVFNDRCPSLRFLKQGKETVSKGYFY